MKVAWLTFAESQREDQLEFIAQDNPRAAASMDEEVGRVVGLLAEQPKMGRPERRRGTRELVIAGTPFVLVYRIAGGKIEVIRFLHGAQQWPPAGEPKS